MSSSRKKMKANIHMSKPELPPFLQKMREQIVANEDADRKERGDQRRKNRGRVDEDPEDDPTVVKINDDDITEEEYKRMKLELETQYKLDDELKTKRSEELNIDNLIEIRRTESRKPVDERQQSSINKSKRDSSQHQQQSSSQITGKGASVSVRKDDSSKSSSNKSKKLSYGSSDDDDDD